MLYIDRIFLITEWLWGNPITSFCLGVLFIILMLLIFIIISEYAGTYIVFLRSTPEEFEHYCTYSPESDDGKGFWSDRKH